MGTKMSSKSTNGWASRALLAVLGALALGMGLGGCVGGVDPSTAEGTLVYPDGAEPLASISEEEWVEAEPDCEGLLTATVSFRVASLAGGLVACVDATGDVICVDSVEEISSDLDQSGREQEAEALAAGFFAAVHAEEMAVAISTMTSDPEPQPNSRPRGIGDPEPQPN